MGNGASGAENQRGGVSNQCFLPDRFLYRGAVRTVVHFWVVWGRKHKRQIMDCWPTVGTLKTVRTQNFSCEVKRKLPHIFLQLIYFALKRQTTDWIKILLTCLFSASAPMCPCRHDTILLCVLWDTTRTSSMRRSICGYDKTSNNRF